LTLDSQIAAWTAPQDKSDVAAALWARGLAAGELLSDSELEEDAQLRARGAFQEFTRDPKGEIAIPTAPFGCLAPTWGSRAQRRAWANTTTRYSKSCSSCPTKRLPVSKMRQSSAPRSVVVETPSIHVQQSALSIVVGRRVRS
jgi:hypothetical protein